MLDQQGDLILVAKCSSIRGFVRPWVRRAFFQKLRIQAWTLVSENLLLNSANEEYAISKRDDTAAWLVHEVQLDRRFEQRCELDFSDVICHSYEIRTKIIGNSSRNEFGTGFMPPLQSS